MNKYSPASSGLEGAYKNYRYFSLDFIRAISILLIIFFHYNDAIDRFTPTGKVFLKHYGIIGNIGISMFFILSGASLMISTQSNYSLINFYKKRFLSIFPLFWTTYMLFILANAVLLQSNPFHGINPATFALTIIGLDGFLFYKIPNFYLIGEWFLGCIIIFYVSFPVIKYLFYKNKQLLMAGSLATCIILEKIYNLDMPLTRFPLFRVFEFVSGMYLMTIYRGYLSKIMTLMIAIVSFVGLFIIIQFEITDHIVISNIVIGIMSFILLLSFSNLYSDYIPQKFIGFLSKYSFAAFLVHHIILNVAVRHSKNILNTMPRNMIMFVALLLFIYLISYLIYNSLRYVLRNQLTIL